MLGGFMLAAMHLCYVFVKTCRGALPKHDTDIPQCGYYYGYLEWLALGVAVVATANNASRTILVSSAIFLLLFVAMGANIMLGARDLRL